MSVISKIVKRIKHNITARRRNRRWLAFSLVFRDAAGRLGTFYLPLFFYQSAQTMEFFSPDFTNLQKGMLVISFYYLFQRLFGAVVNFAQAKLTLKIGHDQSMLLGTAFKAFWLLSLTYIEKNPWFLLLATILAGIETGFFWQSYHTLVCRFSLEKEMGKSLAGFRFLGNFITMLAPALGALIINFFGFNYLFYISILLIMVSIMGLIKLDIAPERDEVNLKEYLSWMKEKSFKTLVFSQIGRYFYDVSFVLWPLYVFLIIADIVKVGYVYTVSLFLAMIVNIFTGDFLDKKAKHRTPFAVSGGILSVISMLRVLVTGAWEVVVIDTSNRMLGNFYWLIHDKIIFSRGRGSQDFSYFVYNEVNRSIAAVIFWFFMLVFFFLVRVDWIGLFALGSVGILLSLLAKEKFNK